MLQQFLANLFEKFKTEQPKTFAVIAVILTGLYASLNSGAFAEAFGSPTWLNRVLEVLVFVLALLGGTHTSQYTAKK